MAWYVYLERYVYCDAQTTELLKLDASSKEEATAVILREYTSNLEKIHRITLLEISQAFDMMQALKLEQLHLESIAKANRIAQEKKIRFEQYLKLKEEFDTCA